jgi:hypothetical protein
LQAHGAWVVVIGQVAGIMHGSRELTGDLDLLWDGDPKQAPAAAAGFASVRASLADPDGVAIPCAPGASLGAVTTGADASGARATAGVGRSIAAAGR